MLKMHYIICFRISTGFWHSHRWNSLPSCNCNVFFPHKKSLKLDEIPGLLTVKKVNPKEVNKRTNTRITNKCAWIHGRTGCFENGWVNWKWQGGKKKERKKKCEWTNKHKIMTCSSDARTNVFVPAFARLKAKGLKECNVCHEIKRSVCSKSSCMINSRRPQMLTTATSTSARKEILLNDISSSESESSGDSENEFDSDDSHE